MEQCIYQSAAIRLLESRSSVAITWLQHEGLGSQASIATVCMHHRGTVGCARNELVATIVFLLCVHRGITCDEVQRNRTPLNLRCGKSRGRERGAHRPVDRARRAARTRQGRLGVSFWSLLRFGCELSVAPRRRQGQGSRSSIASYFKIETFETAGVGKHRACRIRRAACRSRSVGGAPPRAL